MRNMQGATFNAGTMSTKENAPVEGAIQDDN